MAAYFKLFDKETKEAVNFIDVDEAICKHMNAPYDEKTWCCHWYPIVGLMLATGHDFEWCQNEVSDDLELSKIVRFLEDHYDVESWWGR